jgi:hypothetical protein
MRLAPHYCRHYPGVGHHAHPASLQACLRPTSSCPCPLSPRNVRLGCLSLRRRAWARRRRARRDGVSHTSERLQSRLKSAFPTGGRPPRASLRRYPPPSCGACPAPANATQPPCAAWLRGALASSRGALGGTEEPCARRGGAKRPFEFPIRRGKARVRGSYGLLLCCSGQPLSLTRSCLTSAGAPTLANHGA